MQNFKAIMVTNSQRVTLYSFHPEKWLLLQHNALCLYCIIVKVFIFSWATLKVFKYLLNIKWIYFILNKYFPGIGEKVWTQCAGFIRVIPRSDNKNSGKLKVNMLDRTQIHPESYSNAAKVITQVLNTMILQLATV